MFFFVILDTGPELNRRLGDEGRLLGMVKSALLDCVCVTSFASGVSLSTRRPRPRRRPQSRRPPLRSPFPGPPDLLGLR